MHVDEGSPIEEARRELTICNACRYCEGYCAVFPALERGSLADGDVVFLANICHDCRACLQACMYSPPHEFGVDLPRSLAAVRTTSYGNLVWPPRLGWTIEHPVATKVGSLAGGMIVAVVAALLTRPRPGFTTAYPGRGGFYRVISSAAMTGLFLALAAVVLVLLAAASARFWTTSARSRGVSLRAVVRATAYALTLRNLRGGGGGCYYPDPGQPSERRRIYHSLLVGGLLCAFGATIAAAVQQHLLGQLPPYPLFSVPVILGVVGGAGVIIGSAGLGMARRAATRRRGDSTPMLEYCFIGALEVVAVTGILLLVVRSSAAMPIVLVVHLGAVAGLYLGLPFDKFAHAVHRLGALVLDAAEIDAARDAAETTRGPLDPTAPAAGLTPASGQR
jgi:citrate/tricarballylate utilization protein